jgi:hypothetical protein
VKAEREGTLPSANPLMDRLRARRGMTSEQKRADVFARLKAVKPNSADEDVTTKVLRLLTKGWVSSKAIRIVRGFSDGKRCNFHTQRTLAERNGFKLEWADNPKDDTDFLFRFVQSDQS